jgi:hypothetical protein
MGLAKTLNFGINKASYELISRVDQDDLMEYDYLTNHLKVFAANPLKIVVTHWALKVNQNNEICGKIMPSQDDALQRFEILFMNKYVHSAITFKKSEVLKMGGYPTNNEMHPPEDYFLWSKIFEVHKNPFFVIPKFLTKYRVMPNSMTQINPEIAKNAKKIAYMNLSRMLGDVKKKDLEWAEYVSSRIHDRNSINEIKRIPQTFKLILKLSRMTELKLTFLTVRKTMEIAMRIHLPYNIRELFNHIIKMGS